MEMLVGFVQALVFMLLTAVFTLLIAQHEPGEEAHIKISADRRSGDRQNNQIQKNMILPLLAEMSGSIHVGLAAMGAASALV